MAIKSQQAVLNVSTAVGSPKTISGATAANPVVVTATSHGFANGAIVTIAGVVGMTNLNGRAFVVNNQTTNTFELKGVDGTLYSAWVSGGTATPQTMTQVGSVSDIGGFDGQSQEIDVTNLSSLAKEFVLGLQDFGNVTLKLFLVSDTGQTKLRNLKEQAASAAFSITLSDATVSAFVAYVKQFTFSVGGPDSAVTGAGTLRVTGAPAWFA